MNSQTDAVKSVLELKVKNHPGVMSHICGLFARRAYNMEGILCMPMKDKSYSHIWLLVNEDSRLEQVIKQTQKLVDVFEVKHHHAEHEMLVKLNDHRQSRWLKRVSPSKGQNSPLKR